jgi:hypothetical protein
MDNRISKYSNPSNSFLDNMAILPVMLAAAENSHANEGGVKLSYCFTANIPVLSTRCDFGKLQSKVCVRCNICFGSL